MLSQSPFLTGQLSAPESLWEHDFDDNSRVLAQVCSMQTGERIAIKTAYIKKHGMDFETPRAIATGWINHSLD